MRYRLRTLLIATTVVCLFCGWVAYLRRMATHYRALAAQADAEHRRFLADYPRLVQKHPSIVLAVFLDHPDQHHSERARDFDYALLRPWLAFVHCRPGSLFGAPAEQELPAPTRSPAPIVKRLTTRDDGLHEGDY